MSTEQMRWLVKVFQPENTVASLPGAASLAEPARAALLGLEPEVYSAELARLSSAATASATALLAEPAVATMIERLPLKAGARIYAFGDSRTSDPQSWAVILSQMLASRASVAVRAVSGEATTHGLVRIGEVLARDPDWVLFFIGLNDARTQGPNPTKTLVDRRETASNLAELRARVIGESRARCLWITPAAVSEERVSKHWAWSRFGVRFRNEDIAHVAEAMRGLGDPTVDLFSRLGAPPADEVLDGDGLHFTQAGQQRVTLEVLRAWSEVR
jgi:acyl-CoA thioesterase-1